jgi:hypothetical protein
MSVVNDVPYRKVVDLLCVRLTLGRKQRVDLKDIVGPRANTDKATEDKIDVCGMVIVMRASETDNRSTGFRVVILLQIRVPWGKEMLVRVLSQEANVVRTCYDGLGIII